MKKTLSILFVLSVISSAVFARRIESPTANTGVVISKDGSTFKLYYRSAEQSNVRIAIHDASDNMVFSEVLKGAGSFVRPYNFSNLPEGEYTIEVTDKNGRQIESVQFTKDKIQRMAHLSKVAGTEKYVLSIPNKTPAEITVRIYDAADHVIYYNQEKVENDFARVYDLGKHKGSFSFEITDSNGNQRILSY